VIPFRRVCLVLALLFAAYFETYYHLSRRGDAWCRQYNCCGFLYVLPHDTPDWYEWHQFCSVVFMPANEIDRALGGKLYPVRCILFGLSK
jgi:hypothetical protein